MKELAERRQDRRRREVRPARSRLQGRHGRGAEGLRHRDRQAPRRRPRHRPRERQVTWKETISDNREPFLQAGEVDLVLASYSITDERREVVGQAGPYFVTGQQLMVKKGSDIKSVDDLKGKEVCSVTGSTSLENVEAEGAKPRRLRHLLRVLRPGARRHRRRDDHRRRDPARATPPQPRASSRSSATRSPRSASASATPRTTRRCASGSTDDARGRPSRTAPGQGLRGHARQVRRRDARAAGARRVRLIDARAGAGTSGAGRLT